MIFFIYLLIALKIKSVFNERPFLKVQGGMH